MMSFLESHGPPLPIETLLVEGGYPAPDWVPILLVIESFIVHTKAHLPGLDRCNVVI